MGKRKQPEACSADTGSKVVESGDTPPVEQSTVNVPVTTEDNPTVGGSAEGRLGGTVDKSPQPAAAGEHSRESKPETETLWSFFAKAGYLVW